MSSFSERLVGQQLGGFRIRRFIARGGMGVVYEGFQESLQRAVAIKVLYPHLSESADFIERFQREARAIAQLRHPHIVDVIDAGADAGYHYMVMQLIDGRSLRDTLLEQRQRGDQFSTAQALRIINEVGAALTYAHRRGFVHRDVKPGNVLLDHDDGAHLSDFGLVKAVGAEGITQTGATLGTPEYMAPEQYTGAEDVGPASDQYAFAVLAYELLAGRAPFSAPTPAALIHKHLSEPPPSPQTFEPQLPGAVGDALLRGLAKEPARRFPSVDALVTALNRAVEGAAADTTVLDVPPAEPPPVSDAAATPSSAPDDASRPPEPLAAVEPVSAAPPSTAPVAVLTAPSAPPAGPPPTAPRRRWFIPAAAVAGVGVVAAVLAFVFLTGGGGSAADPTPSAASVSTQPAIGGLDPTATSAPTNTAMSVAVPSEQVVPVAATDAAPTATPSPRPTYTALPHPIVATTTPLARLEPLQFPTGTAEAGGDPSVLVYQDFSTGDPGPFFIGESEFGSAALTDGKYAMMVPDGNWLSSLPTPAINLGDGGAALDVSLSGDGSAGIVGRAMARDDGSTVLYVCWLRSDGAAGCSLDAADTWTELFSVAPATIALSDVNRLAMVMVGDQLLFEVNDTTIGQTTDASSVSGGWGMYAESASGTVTASFAQIVIAKAEE